MRSILCIAVLAISVSQLVYAEDLGSFRIQGGQTLSAPDRDAAQVLREKAASKYKSGEAQRVIKEIQQRNVDALVNPTPLNIPTSYTRSTKFYSMDFVMPVESKFASKGRTYNVLKATGKISDTADRLILIDGRDKEQVNYAVRLSKSQPTKIILTGGSPINIGKQFSSDNQGNGIPFFFDQQGQLIRSLNTWYGIRINSVPALLSNGGNGNLRVDYGY